MSLFGDLFTKIRTYVRWDFQLQQSLTAFRQYLNNGSNPIIRIWVDGSKGYGHQGSTVGILRQLTNTNTGFNYTGTIQIYYDQAEATLGKLRELLPELNGGNQGQVDGATVTLTPWTGPGSKPAQAVALGFTGGADDIDDRGKITSPNFADKLNTRYFLRLQPYRWGAPEQIQFSAQSFITLTNERVLGLQAFSQRGYYSAPPPLPVWTDYAGSNAAAIVQWLTVTQNQFDFVPVYSIRSQGNLELRKTAAERMFEVITSMLASQRNGNQVRPGARSVVVVSCDVFEGPAARNELADLIDAQAYADGELSWKYDLERSAEEWRQIQPNPAKVSALKDEATASLRGRTNRNNYVTNVDARNRVDYLYNPTLQNVLDKRAWLNESNDRVLFISLGRVPQPLFNYLLGQTTLPPVFEGQGTASTMLTLGKYYLHVARAGAYSVQYPTTIIDYEEYYKIDTESPYMPFIFVPLLPRKLQDVANQLNVAVEQWPADAAKSPPEQVGGFIKQYLTEGPTGEYHTYFNAISTFYRNPANDKLRYGLAFLDYIITTSQTRAVPHALASLAAGAPAPASSLDALLQALDANLDNSKTLHLVPGAFASGGIFDFYSGLLGTGQLFDIAGAVITPQRDQQGTLSAIHVTGASGALGLSLATVFDFTSPNGGVVANGRFTYDESWSPPELPWLVFRNPFVELHTIDDGMPTVGSIGGTIGGAEVELSIRLPVQDGKWQLQGSFLSPYPDIARFFSLVAGVNLLGTLPAPLNTLAGWGVSSLNLAYDSTAGEIEYAGVTATTQSNFDLLPGLEIQQIGLQVTVEQPASTRAVTWSVQIAVKVGARADAGVLLLGAAGPGLTLQGQLASGVITITDILSIFLPGMEFAPQSQPSITEFLFAYTPATGNYAVVCDLNIDQTITVAGKSLTINGLGINARRQTGLFTGGLTGKLTIGSGTDPFVLDLSAEYSTGAGWIFSALQASGAVNLSDLFNQFLPSGWQITTEYPIDGIGLTIATGTNSVTVTGKTAKPWTVPFITDLSVSASLTMGYHGAGAQAVAIPADGPKTGPFGRLETDWTWENIDLRIFFDYAPDAKQFGITWGALQGLIAGPDPTTQDYTATLRFNDSVTLGGLIEDMVSWITGAKFALASPFDLLNAIPLSNLGLIYTFNTQNAARNHVSFSIDIGPIELGFARIDSIEVSYRNKTGTEGTGKGIMVSLNGSFRWKSNPDEPLGWDAAKPETTPAPPGGGNKYFDLRLLAMGQHVTVDGFQQAATVQDAIKAMAQFPAPDPQHPDVLPPVIFDPTSNWLVAMDIGLMRFGDDSKSPATAAGDGSESGYVVTLQIVFNDPNLYGLRIALAGDAAKVFKGLDFQIMYRRISDSVGVYQAEITLPDLMRHLTVGAYSITLPVFAIAVYTNGDFQVDIGFPWNSDFSRSFTIEAIIPPGIPLLGSAGFYFGKLSSATTTRVPAATNGTFNPVIVFGFGMQVGFGKSIEAGILKAGFSVTVVGILEGVIAKWNPYALTNTGGQPPGQVQGAYYFWLRGTVGVMGHLYGSIDFAIIKASVDITVRLLLQLTYESFVAITITVIAAVEVSVSVSIDLGLFSITIHFSFSLQLKETFSIDTAHDAPWTIGAPSQGVLRAPMASRLTRPRAARAALFGAPSGPQWGNLLAATAPAALSGYFATGLTAAQDEWEKTPALASQVPCYVALLTIDAPAPAGSDGHASLRKAQGGVADTSFEALAKMVLRWAVAALQPQPLSARAVDAVQIDPTLLARLTDEILVSTDANPTPLTPDVIDTMLSRQFRLAIALPPAGTKQTVTGAFFPAAPGLSLHIPAYGAGYSGFSYSFGGFNALAPGVLKNLRQYFADLAVQVQQEMDPPARAFAAQTGAPLSMAGWIFADYFLLIARQMVKAAQQALRDFQYQIVPGDTGNGIVGWVNKTGNLTGALSYTLNDLFTANPSQPLNAGKGLTIGVSATVAADDSFSTLALRAQNGCTGSALAGANAAVTGILRAGGSVTFPGQPDYPIAANDTVITIARHFNTSVNDLLASSNLLDGSGLLVAGTEVLLPLVTAFAGARDGFNSVAGAAAFAGGFSGAALALANAGRSVLRVCEVSYPGIKDAYVVRPRDTLGDVANGLGQALSDVLSNATVSGSPILQAPGLLADAASLVLPRFSFVTAAGDTLQAIASRFGVPLAVLADQPANGAIADLFATESADPGRTPAPALDLPHLPQFPLGELISEAQAAGALQHLSGMASRYMLHGLRFPTTGIIPLAAGMWVRSNDGTLGLPPQAGLYALTGQQFPLPVLDSQIGPFKVVLDRSAGPDWISFGQTNQLTLSIDPQSDDALKISRVAAQARGASLPIALSALGAGAMYHAELASYPFASVTVWQSAGIIPLPYGPAAPGVQALRLWRLPDAMAALPDPSARAINPRFALATARYDEATGHTIQSPIASYGWASTIPFTVKRVPGDGTGAAPASSAAATTYEIMGAGGNDIVLLERMVGQIQHDDDAFDSLTVGFAPDTTGAAALGVATGPIDAVTFGIAQVNLSTITKPPGGIAAALVKKDAGTALGLLNKPSDFARLLWEASITRSGGFFLYYYDATGKTGLPDRIFNDRNEAQLTLIVFYAAEAGGAPNRVTNFMNAAVTADAIDTTSTVVFAQADPVPVIVGTARTTPALASLDDLAAAWFTDRATIAQVGAQVPLNPVTLSVRQGQFAAPPQGIALAALAAEFGTSVAALNTANPNWNGLPDPLPYPAAIALPLLTVTGGGTTLAALALRFGEGVTDLADDNAVVPGLFAGPLPVTASSLAQSTLEQLAAAYFADPADLAQSNQAVPLAAVSLTVSEGLYQAPPGGISLATVAANFGTTVTALNAANPKWRGLPDPLPFPAAIRLPRLTVTAGSHPNTTTLGGIASFYGESLSALAAENANVAGLFQGQAVIITGGPRIRAANVPPGVQAVAAVRPPPDPVPAPGDPQFGARYLQNTYTLLNQQILDNVDFIGTHTGLPAGPTTKSAASGPSKIRAVTPESQVAAWDYSQSVVYARAVRHRPVPAHAALPAAADNPYNGVGGLLQVSFDWQDQYGNMLITTLSNPPAGGNGPFNAAPLLTGYTDPLVASGQWPSVAAAWQVVPGGTPQLQLSMSFDASRYAGLLYAAAADASTISAVFTDPLDAGAAGLASNYRLVPAVATITAAATSADGRTVTLTLDAPLASPDGYTLVVSGITPLKPGPALGGQAQFSLPDDPAQRTSSMQQAAQRALATYAKLYYQLTDPNGIALSIQTTLLAGSGGAPGARPLTTAMVSGLMEWLFGLSGGPSIYGFLQDRATFGTSVSPPAPLPPLGFDLDAGALNPAQVFELSLTFTLARTGGAVLGGLETTPGIRQASTRIAPLQDPLAAASGTLGLVRFADNLESALSSPTQRLKVATGSNRFEPLVTGGGATVWVVRLGLDPAQGISYQINPPSAQTPAIFAPAPVSTTLQTRRQVPIYGYTTGHGLSTAPVATDFVDIDLDGWCRQVFAAIDGVLTPVFTAPMQIVGKFRNRDYLQQALDAKAALAKIASRWMIPVFKDGAGLDASAAQEAFRQQLLVRLSDAYSTRAAVLYTATVNAALDEPIPPRLYGTVTPPRPALEAAAVQPGDFSTITLQFTDPLDPVSAGIAANYTLDPAVQVMRVAVSGSAVTLTVSADTVPGTTTVTIQNLTDSSGRPILPPLSATVMIGNIQEPAISLSAPKLSLAAGAANPLVFLVSAPATVLGFGGEVISQIPLNLTYQAAQIEHQIGSVLSASDYQASSWLSFVLPVAGAPLWAPLTQPGVPLQIPLVLRSFPTTPTMAGQSGTPTYPLDQADIGNVTRWDYTLTYTLPFHFPQDRVDGKVEFNLRPQLRTQAGIGDAFAQLAEFVSVFPAVEADLIGILAAIDASTDPSDDSGTPPTGKQKVDDAAIALDTFLQITNAIVTAAGGAEGTRRLAVARPQRPLAGAASLTYSFYIDEGEIDYDGTDQVLLVTITGALAVGMSEAPIVRIASDTYKATRITPPGTQPASDRFSYVYKRISGSGTPYLTAADGQAIPERIVVLPGLDILQRQDAFSTVYLERNRELVPGRPTADSFVYTTPSVGFSSPLFPVNDADAHLDIAQIGSANPPAPATRSLTDHLTALFGAILAANIQPDLTFQVEVSYSYALNPGLSDISLPVLMQAPLKVSMQGGAAPQVMIDSWATAIQSWFEHNLPEGGGTLWFDLVIMSDLTQQPMPLLRLRKLFLGLPFISPELAVLSPSLREH